MNYKVGIIRETKVGETRVAFSPKQLKRFIDLYEIPVFMELSDKRCFSDEEYRKVGIKIVKKLRDCNIIFGFKEDLIRRIEKNKIYFCFSHTAQGQEHNLPLLKKLVQKKSSLIDYEEIDRHYEKSMRLGRYAGMVGAVEAMNLLHKRFTQEKLFSIADFLHLIPQDYENSNSIKDNYKQINTMISSVYHPFDIPIVIGIVGNGRITDGVMEMLQCLPYRIADPNCEITTNLNSNLINIVKFDRSHTRDAYYFETYLPYLTVLINAIKWNPSDEPYITYESLYTLQSDHYPKSRLKLIMDISCDLNGPIEPVDKTTTFKNPYYIKNDVWISAIDNLPAGITDLAKEASEKVGNTLLSFFEKPLDIYTFFDNLSIYGYSSKAVIVKKGKVLDEHLKELLK